MQIINKSYNCKALKKEMDTAVRNFIFKIEVSWEEFAKFVWIYNIKIKGQFTKI